MSDWPLRLVHAGDFHLQRPVCGAAEVPDHLRELFLEAPYWAAERVFETALSEKADLLVLAGDLLDARATGPRGPQFLVEQFERLAERGIPVYWAGGRVDPPKSWPASITLPGNVHRFPPGRPEDCTFCRDSVPVARLVGASFAGSGAIRAGDFDPDPAGLISIAVARGTAEPEALAARGMHYWALGGRHSRGTLLEGPRPAHYSGSPQGRTSDEPGAHGCTLVDVNHERQVRTTLIPTDVVRWHTAEVQVHAATTREELEGTLRERIGTLIESAPGMDLLIAWTVSGQGPLLRRLRRGELADELLAGLRKDFGFGPPAAWSVSLEAEAPLELPAELADQETILGDFLREIRHLQTHPDEPLELDDYVAEPHRAGTLGAAVAVTDPATRDAVLREAAVLGVDLLSGEGPSR